jgi:alkylhydroperoxidase family enzyme
MRIPYTPNPPPTSTEEEAAILERVQARRAATGLLPLDLALLHSFPVADGWNSFLGAIRTRTSIPADLREIAMCRVAALNGAWFEWKHHAPLLVETGFSEAALELVKREPGKEATDDELAALMTEQQAAVLRYTESMTKTVKVPEEVFAKVQGLFTEREVVEITATIAAYNCVSRFLVALDVGEMNQ